MSQLNELPGHAYAPGTINAAIDVAASLPALAGSGSSIVLAVLVAGVIASKCDDLFSPPVQRRFGPKRR